MDVRRGGRIGGRANLVEPGRNTLLLLLGEFGAKSLNLIRKSRDTTMKAGSFRNKQCSYPV